MSNTVGLIALKKIIGTKDWLIYTSCLWLFSLFCLAVVVVVLTIL